jgi:hypothetical protein
MLVFWKENRGRVVFAICYGEKSVFKGYLENNLSVFKEDVLSS